MPTDPIRCDVCGRFIAYADLDTGAAVVTLLVPDNAFGGEKYERLCARCNAKEKAKEKA